MTVGLENVTSDVVYRDCPRCGVAPSRVYPMRVYEFTGSLHRKTQAYCNVCKKTYTLSRIRVARPVVRLVPQPKSKVKLLSDWTLSDVLAAPEDWAGCYRASGGSGSTRWKLLRKLIFERDGSICRIQGPVCLVDATEIDHIVSRQHGGNSHPSNLRAACGPCNRWSEIQYGCRDCGSRNVGKVIDA